MSVNLKYLRASDVLQDMNERRPTELAKGYLPIGMGLFSAFGGYGIHKIISCGCYSFLAERTFELVSDTLYLNYRFVYPIIGFTIGYAIPLMIDNVRIHINEKYVKANFLYRPREIIGKQTYEKLLINLHSNLSDDLEKKFNVPNDSQVNAIMKDEEEFLDGMLKAILIKKYDNIKIYTHALNRIGSETAIVDFLIMRTSLPAVDKIQDFGIQNNLKRLQEYCIKYLELSEGCGFFKI